MTDRREPGAARSPPDPRGPAAAPPVRERGGAARGARARPALHQGRQPDRLGGEPVARELDLAAGLRPRLLRHRDDGHAGPALRPVALRRRGHAALAAAGGPHDRGRAREHQDGAGAAPALRPDARPQVGHLDGRLRLVRRRSSTTTRSCRAWTRSCPWTSTCPAARRGPSRSSTASSSCRRRSSPRASSSGPLWRRQREEEGGRVTPLTPERIEERLRERFPGVEFRRQSGEAVRDHTLYLPAASLVEVCTFLRDDPELDFAMLSWISGVDWLPREPRFEVVYGLLSLSRAVRLTLKVRGRRGEPARPHGHRRVAHRRLARARDLRLLRDRVHRPPQPGAHPAARGLGGLAAAQGLAARLRGGGLHPQHAGPREALARAQEARAEEGEIPCAVRR